LTGSRRKKDYIEAYRHEKDRKKNVTPVGLAFYGTSKAKKGKCDFYLNSQLILTSNVESPEGMVK
jgi:hypothetical protein